jgi:hypothetical protein
MTIVDRSSRARCCYSKMHESDKILFPGDCACEEALHKRDAKTAYGEPRRAQVRRPSILLQTRLCIDAWLQYSVLVALHLRSASGCSSPKSLSKPDLRSARWPLLLAVRSVEKELVSVSKVIEQRIIAGAVISLAWSIVPLITLALIFVLNR